MCRERKDSLGEEKVNEFLREHLYGGKYGLVKTRYSLDGSKVVRYETVTEKIRQSAGEDMLLYMDDKRVVVIDEKAALYYPNPRKTINTGFQSISWTAFDRILCVLGAPWLPGLLFLASIFQKLTRKKRVIELSF